MTNERKMNQSLKLLLLNVPWFALFSIGIWETMSISGPSAIFCWIFFAAVLLFVLLAIFAQNAMASVALAIMAAILTFFDFKTTDNVKNIMDQGSYLDGHIQIRSTYILLILVSLTSALINAKSDDVRER